MVMKLFTLLYTLLISAYGLAGQDAAQPTAAQKSRYISTIGEVVSMDAAAKQVKVKTDKGEEFTIPLQDRTSYLRMPPGEKELSKATRIEPKDISVGDRVLARTPAGTEGPTLGPAASIIVMTKADLAQYHEKSRAEWEKRGTVGTVASLDPATKSITISVSGLTPKDSKSIILDPEDKVVYRRYAPGSAKFQDAKPSTFADIKVGDRVRVLGDKNEDGTHIKPEEIVTGTFRTIAATIISIDPATNSMKVNDLTTKKPVIVKINADSSIKRLPPMMSNMLARMQNPGATGQGGEGGPRGGGPGGGRPAGAGAAAGPGGGEGGGPGRGGFGGGMRGGAANLPQMIERLPQITLADLKPGDALVISGAAGNDATELAAITAIAGVEPILTAPSKDGGRSAVSGNWNFGDIGLPQ
jgi:Cu/Ag efflux protein CusF